MAAQESAAGEPKERSKSPRTTFIIGGRKRDSRQKRAGGTMVWTPCRKVLLDPISPGGAADRRCPGCRSANGHGRFEERSAINSRHQLALFDRPFTIRWEEYICAGFDAATSCFEFTNKRDEIPKLCFISQG